MCEEQPAEDGRLVELLAGALVVSCQAYPGEPMRDPRTMTQVARSVVSGGARAVRLQGLADVRQARPELAVPIIGIWKAGDTGVFITPTLEHARAVRAAGADIVATDGTRRERPDGKTLAETISALKADQPTVVMADCGSLEDAIAADAAGADLIGTTLAGYTGEREATRGPDLELVELIVNALPGRRVVAEGRIHTPTHAREAAAAGAYAVVVGTAITHPSTITSWFHAALDETTGESQ